MDVSDEGKTNRIKFCRTIEMLNMIALNYAMNRSIARMTIVRYRNIIRAPFGGRNNSVQCFFVFFFILKIDKDRSIKVGSDYKCKIVPLLVV